MKKILLSILTIGIAVSAIAKDKPNLIFVIADDMTHREIGCCGGQALTPNIDRLATEGMRFERCFQTAPMCSPTRHTIYTGMYPVKSGAYPNHTNAYDDVKSIVHHLQPLGYRVALSGKTHIGPTKVFPFEYTVHEKNPDMKVIDAMFADSAKSGEPFCLFACSNEPHTPWNKGDASVYPPEKIKLPPYIVDTPVVREEFSRYLAEITYYDGQVGQILKMLKKHGLSENTVVMVVSEQGNSMPFAKWTCYDTGLQSAMIVRWPGKVEAGAVTDAMVEYVDVTPTFVEMAGGKAPAGIDGKSFVNVLEGKTNEHKSYVYGIMTTRGIINGSDAYGIRSIRGWKYKLIKNLNHENEFTNAYTKGDAFKSMEAKAATGDEKAQKLVRAYQIRPAIELYKIEEDPLEMNNLASNPEYAKIVKRLSVKLDEWMESQGDEGIATEMRAKERQGKGIKKSGNNKRPS